MFLNLGRTWLNLLPATLPKRKFGFSDVSVISVGILIDENCTAKRFAVKSDWEALLHEFNC